MTLFKLAILLPIARGSYYFSLRPDSFTRDFPAWMFPLFLIPLILAMAYMIFGYSIFDEIWGLFHSFKERSEEEKRRNKEDLCVVYNLLNRCKAFPSKAANHGPAHDEVSRALSSWAEVSRLFPPGKRKLIGNCLNSLENKKKHSSSADLDRSLKSLDKKIAGIKLSHE